MHHPLFHDLTNEERTNLLTRCQTHTFTHHQPILKANETREGLFLIQSGTVEVYLPAQDHDEVLEIIKKDQLIGLSHFIHFLSDPDSVTTDEASLLQVRAIDDVTALYIPFSVLKERWSDPAVREYLLTQVSARLHDVYQSLAEQIQLGKKLTESDTSALRVQDVLSKKFVQAATTDTIQTVAKKLSETNQTAAVITENNELQGIITMHDFVNRVITNGKNLTDPVHTVMTPNPITIEHTAYFYESITTMLLHGIKHLPVTDNKQTVGIVTLTELLQIKSANFLKGTTEISTTNIETLPTLKTALYSTLGTMLQQQVPTLHALDVMNTLYDQLIQRCIELAIEEMSPTDAPARFCFYLMGSAGRREQFLLTDQDHFLVYEDDSKKEYFEQLSEKIVANLEHAGYKRCPGDMMASNPQWRGDLQQWESRIREWVLHATNDRLLLAQNFFSYRLIYGDDILHEQFKASIEQSLDRAKIFLYRLSQLERENPIPALEQPIRSIFRMQKKTIDLKKHILFPYHHSLQILALMNGVTYGTPIEKIDQLHEKKILSNSFQKDLKASIESILDYYVKNRWNQHQKGEALTSTLDLTKLTTREKEELMLSIRLIKELQSHMLSYY
ncbi:DUF294 nucleotidyltransferase-like domain-containing protein [Bacillus tianshenii]|uniref:DUF294 nucleotidyltransferase-like domain-containing protein n=1 Tax=Sutcliffiella tianshenii TaxID=1463404 RepID=UPI001CD77C10|nr:DUF294 nucleotidyltransferase-like domain-containing protein [Bacillus tianshenii]MCA1320251.1 DUF294 nucleotidyltransferase-like domain-containing protein [Bacillus tianshenii]